MRVHIGAIHRGVGEGACAPGTFQDPQSPWLTDADGYSTTPHCVVNTYWSKVAQQMGIPRDIADQLPVGFDPTAAAVPGARPIADWWANPGAGGCPIVAVNDGAHASCAGMDLNTGQFIFTPCADYRECDAFTSATHKEYALPLPTGNVTMPWTGTATPGDIAAAYQAIGTSKVQQQAPLPVQPGQVITGGPTFHPTANAQPTQQQLLTASQTDPADVGQQMEEAAAQQSQQGNFLTDHSMVDGVPNWALIGVAIVGVLMIAGRH